MTTSIDFGIVPEFTQGDRFRKARELTGLGQREFAAELGVSQQTVTNAEKGHTKVRRITLNAWSLATGVAREWLETGIAPAPQGDGGNQSGRRDSNSQHSAWNTDASVTVLRPVAVAA